MPRRLIESRRETKRHYLWATTHPFAYSADWVSLESHTKVREAAEEFPPLLSGRAIDDEIVRTVADRVWLLVLNRKQERVFLTPEEVGQVHTLLNRKAASAL